MGKIGMLKRSLVAAAISVSVLGGTAAMAGAQDATPVATPAVGGESAAPAAALPNTGVGTNDGGSTDAMLFAVLGIAGIAGTAGVVAIKRSSR